jgi:hypothetical protein
MMGAGYIAGAYFFVRVAREARWHRIQVGFLPVTAFVLFMAIGTFDLSRRLHHGQRRVLGLVRAVRGHAGPRSAGVVAQPCDGPRDAGTW